MKNVAVVASIILLLAVGWRFFIWKRPVFRSVADADRATLVGTIPEKYISYGPQYNKREKDLLMAGIVFKSEDIEGYEGVRFSADIDIELITDNAPELDTLGRRINNVKDSKFDKKTHSRKDIFEDLNHFILVDVYEEINPNSNSVNTEYLLIDGTEEALFRYKFTPDKEHGFYGIVEYRSRINNKCIIRYRLQLYTFEPFSHRPFLYAKDFLESFYINNHNEY